MVQVLIVAKTKMGAGVCLGGLVLNTRRSVRLLSSSPDRYSLPNNTPFNLGDIWDLRLMEVAKKQAPHTEDIIIRERYKYIRTMPMSELKDFLAKQTDPSFVHPEALFDRLIRFTWNKKGFVSPAGGLPPYSTGFWRFKGTFLLSHNKDRKPYYGYTRDSIHDVSLNISLDVPYVGLQEPLETISPGALLRFSLTRGFRNDPQKRCYLQLSGWFL